MTAAAVRPFTSDLTIDETLLLHEVGFEPIDLVMGATYVNVGWSPSTSWFTNQELGNVSALMLASRNEAIKRLVEQAKAARADGVVGMRIEIESEGTTAEFSAIGTAVRRIDGDGRAWHARGNPFTCHLSGADFWGLVRAGFRPASLAHGVCVYHVARQMLGQWWKTMRTGNMEMEAYTQGLYDARELAMGRLLDNAKADGATAGIIGVEVREGSHGWDTHVIEMSAMGTGVAPIGDGKATHDAVKLVIDANDAK